MKPMDLFIFDLDGTLLDSLAGATAAMNRVLASRGLPPVQPGQMAACLHSGVEYFARCASRIEDPAQLGRLVEEYQAEYLAHCCDPLYPGVPQTLAALLARGKKLAVLSNKPQALACCQLELTGLAPYFWRVLADDGLTPLKPRPEGVLRLVKEAGCPAARTVVVGDSLPDLEAGRTAGAAVCFASYGIGRPAPAQLRGCRRIGRFSQLLEFYD